VLTRYIHQNPLKAGVAISIADCLWSSYRDYTSGSTILADTGLILDMFSENRKDAVEQFIEFHKTSDDTDRPLPDRRSLASEAGRVVVGFYWLSVLKRLLCCSRLIQINDIGIV
jgi:hypothetical protein